MDLEFRTSSFCGSNACVDVAFDRPARLVWVRRKSGPVTSKPMIPFTYDEWDAFVAGVRNGEFDLPSDF